MWAPFLRLFSLLRHPEEIEPIVDVSGDESACSATEFGKMTGGRVYRRPELAWVTSRATDHRIRVWRRSAS